MANRNFANSRIYSGHVMPVHIDCEFTVASSDSAGLGITSLVGPYVQNIFMHTSATPGAGNKNPATSGIAITNPNPAVGLIVIQLQDTYKKLYMQATSISSPKSGSDLKVDNSALTIGNAYTISTLGNTTAAQWATLGVPAGIVPAVGVSFIAALVGVAGEANTSTSRVQAPASAGSQVMSMELVQAASADVSPNIQAQGFGSQFILQCRDKNGALIAPVDGTTIRLSLLLSNSSIAIQGD
jgi:hypothetical protein